MIVGYAARSCPAVRRRITEVGFCVNLRDLYFDSSMRCDGVGMDGICAEANKLASVTADSTARNGKRRAGNLGKGSIGRVALEVHSLGGTYIDVSGGGGLCEARC